jgi:hypothetical protein
LVAYSQAIANLHYRQGTLLPFNNVFMAEGEWDPEAYYDAYRRAKSRTYAFDASNRKRTEPAEFVEATFETESGQEYFNAEPLPESHPMTTESVLSPPAKAATESTTDPAPDASADFTNEGLNDLRKVPEPSPLNLLAPPGTPAKPRTAKSIKRDRNSAQTSPVKQNAVAARTPIRHTMSPAARATNRPSLTAPSTRSTASTIEPASANSKSAPDSDGFLAPIRVSTSCVTRVRAK